MPMVGARCAIGIVLAATAMGTAEKSFGADLGSPRFAAGAGSHRAVDLRPHALRLAAVL